MKLLHILAFILVVVGALNWGLVGLMKVNVVEMLFGMLTNVVYMLVGLSGLYLLVTHQKDCKVCSSK